MGLSCQEWPFSTMLGIPKTAPWRFVASKGGIPQRLGKPSNVPFAHVLSTFVFRSGGFELKRSLVATFLEGFSVTSHERRVPGSPFSKNEKGTRGTLRYQKSRWSCQKWPLVASWLGKVAASQYRRLKKRCGGSRITTIFSAIALLVREGVLGESGGGTPRVLKIKVVMSKVFLSGLVRRFSRRTCRSSLMNTFFDFFVGTPCGKFAGKFGGDFFLGTFWRPPTHRRHLHRNSGECGGPSPELWWMSGSSREYGVVGSPKFAKVRQGSPKFAWRRAHASGTLWNLPDFRTHKRKACAKLSTTTAREQNRALGPPVYGRYPNPGKHRKIISTIAFARLAKIWSSAVVVDSSVLPEELREAKPGCFQTRVFPHFFRERSRLCRGPFRDCSS